MNPTIANYLFTTVFISRYFLPMHCSPRPLCFSLCSSPVLLFAFSQFVHSSSIPSYSAILISLSLVKDVRKRLRASSNFSVITTESYQRFPVTVLPTVIKLKAVTVGCEILKIIVTKNVAILYK